MKIKTLMALGLGLITSSLASANVMYQWETLSTSSTIWSAVGRIEITDSAGAAGTGSYQAAPNCQLGSDCTSYGDPLSPIVSFYFTINNSTATEADINLNLIDGSGALYPLTDWFHADFTLSGANMDLSVYANTGETEMQMSNNDITRFSSDAPYFGFDCFGAVDRCSGATGQWVRVPEPATATLFGLGLLGLGGLYRRHM